MPRFSQFVCDRCLRSEDTPNEATLPIGWATVTLRDRDEDFAGRNGPITNPHTFVFCDECKGSVRADLTGNMA